MTVQFIEDTEIYRKHYLEQIPYPKLVMLETSSFCNLRCPMCPRTIGKSPSAGANGQEFGNLKMDLLDRLDSLFRNTRSVVLSWFGEPLINKQLPDIVRRIKTYNLSVHITTNGMLLTERVAEELIHAGLDHMAISMDGATPETFRRLREGAELEIVKQNILNLNRVKRRLGSATPHLQVAFVAMPENVAEMPAMVRLVDEMNIRNFTIGPLDDFALTQDFDLARKGAFSSRDHARESYRAARDLARELGIAIGLESPARFYHEMGDPPPEFAIDERFFQTDLTPAQTTALGFRKGCGVAWLDTVIGYNGDVHPCCVSGRVLGNVYENTFEEIWWGSKYRAFRAALKSTHAPSECGSCRRAHWNGSHRLEELRDTFVVGRHEVHGQGWISSQTDSSGRAHRQIDRTATFFLRDHAQPFLDLELGTYAPFGTACEITINDVNLPRLQVRAGWHHYFVRLPARAKNDFLQVQITSVVLSQVLIRAAQLREIDPRTLWERLDTVVPITRLPSLWYVARQFISRRAPWLAWVYRRVRQKALG
ncbi:MAG: radical SAM protein [Chloroflexi bacterium]|nr:radical SAM protein [Chloroflexota bacterium]